MRYRLPPFSVQQVLTALAETVDWSLVAYGIPKHWLETRGRDVNVAVLDTGIEADHPDLLGAILDARDFSGSRSGPTDKNGHGTHVAGVIAARKNELGVVGLANECQLLPGKVLGDDGSGTDYAVSQGIVWAVESGAHVISLSLGGPHYSASIAQHINWAVEKGVFVICAAGNSGGGGVNFPARLETTIAVGAVDRYGRVAEFSSRGDEVDVCAPGQDVLSTYLRGGYARLSGTSMATPFVTGVVALMLSKHMAQGGETPLKTQQQLQEHLRRTATDAGPRGLDPSYGYGLINPDKVLARMGEPERGRPEPTPIAGGVWVWIPGAYVAKQEE